MMKSREIKGERRQKAFSLQSRPFHIPHDSPKLGQRRQVGTWCPEGTGWRLGMRPWETARVWIPSLLSSWHLTLDRAQQEARHLEKSLRFLI